MALGIEVTCNSCGAVSEQTDGPFMSGFNPRCDRCGATRFVPLEALTPDGAPDAPHNYSKVYDVAGVCECGGRFAPEAPIRCLTCRSTDVTSVVTLCAD